MPVLDGGSVPLDAHSICIHGDTAGALDMAQVIRARLAEAGVALAPFVN